MHIGILQTGRVNERLVGDWGEYPPMVAAMFAPVAPDFTFSTWAAVDGDIPDDPTLCDGWVLPGSRHGVYDPLPWIAPLKGFIRDIRAAGRPMVGICFGHQIIAAALGGAAEKVDHGWGVGRHRYAVAARPSWMADAGDELALYCSHQDQVTAIPDNATTLAGNAHCPHAMIAFGDPEHPAAVTVQAHPEYPRGYADGLYEVLRWKGNIAAEQAASAIASTATPVEGQTVAGWFATYLRRSAEASRAA
ncbi:MAG: hypothetical protein AAF577_07540 [Pseudomonadota bacterium]